MRHLPLRDKDPPRFGEHRFASTDPQNAEEPRIHDGMPEREGPHNFCLGLACLLHFTPL